MGNSFQLDCTFVNDAAGLYHDDQLFGYRSSKEFARRRASTTPVFIQKPLSTRRCERDIRELLHTTFWASLTPEEGRYHAFALAHLPREREWAGEPLCLQEPMPFTATTLAKVSPAVPSTHSIGVWRESYSKDGALRIWGFAPRVKGYPLLLRVIKPGQILVAMSEDIRAGVTAQESRFVDESLKLERIFGRVRPASSTSNFFVEAHRAGDLSKVALSMRAHGHGGALLVVPDEEAMKTGLVEVRYRVSAYENIKSQITKRDNALEQFGSSGKTVRANLSELIKQVDVSLESIGQLTAVDGAAVVTRDLVVLGFGAKIGAIRPLTDDSVVLRSNPFCRARRTTVFKMDWGMRHRSAAQFVFDHRDSLAIVASQDGRLSLFIYDSEEDVLSVTEDAEFVLL